MTDARTADAEKHEIATLMRGHAELCMRPGYSPFYARLLTYMADDCEAGGPTWTALEPAVGGRVLDVPQLRVLGFVHRMVLRGEAPELAAHFPSAGGDGDADAAWPPLRTVLEQHARDIHPWLEQPPQTNEVGRCAALAAGFAEVATRTGLPLRLLEIGASAGLNLQSDRYYYESDGVSAGDPASAVRFVDLWNGGTPPFGAGLPIVDRAGCDVSPIDATTEEGRLLLLGYVWPDQTHRFQLLQDALAIMARHPVQVDRANAFDWVPPRLDDRPEGVATVVYHSLVMQYFAQDDIDRFHTLLDDVGATADAPLAWLRLEPGPDVMSAELRLTTWPGDEEQLIAKASFHIGPMEWLT